MLSQVQIVNVALGRLGITTRIASMNDSAKEAREASLIWALCVDRVLRDFPWAFATRAVALAQQPDTFTFPGWGYAYIYPTDCVQGLAVMTAAGMRQPCDYSSYWYEQRRYIPGRPAWQVVMGPTQDSRAILTDVAEAYLVYVVRLSNPAMWPADFDSALAMLLAAELAMPLRVDAKTAQRASDSYVAAASVAKAANFNEGRPDAEPDSPSVTVRGE